MHRFRRLTSAYGNHCDRGFEMDSNGFANSPYPSFRAIIDERDPASANA
jgi:hypothetical protein